MRERLSLLLALTCLIPMWPAPAARGQGTLPAQARVADLAHDLGKTVTVVGRTGNLVAQYESQALHVFTLRDDYGDQALVRTLGEGHPVMGVTYRVTGVPTRINGTLFLDSAPDMMSPLYPLTAPAPPPPSPRDEWLPWIPTILSGAGVLLVLGYLLARWLGRPRPEWGVLTVTSGPDRGLTVPLSRRRVALGRGVSPARDVRLSGGDETISNRHALLEHRGGRLYLCDMSTNGTRIGGKRLRPGRPTRINSGDLIHLGTRGTVIIVQLHAAPPAPSLLGRLREPAPLSDKTLMVSEMPVEEPAWKNITAQTAEAFSPAAGAAASPAAAPAPPPQSAPAVGGHDEDDEEDDIPHTLAPPMIFTFAGHPPKPGRAFSENGHRHEADETAPADGTD